MNDTAAYSTLFDFLRALRQRRWLWLAPAVLLTATAAALAFLQPKMWEASQALTVRQEAVGFDQGNGRFSDLTEMKTAQETVLELARSKDVLRASLAQLGPPAQQRSSGIWPPATEVEDFRDRLQMTPAKGAEFGATEVFYIKVRDRSRDRAVALVGALCDQVEQHYQRLRNAKAQSMIDELERAESLAAKELADATNQLTTFERRVGADLAELRILNTLSSGSSDIRQELVAVDNDLRRYEAEKERNRQLLAVLEAAGRDPSQIIATPNSLLDSQPALRRLKDGLVDAQLRSAQLVGTMTEEHPSVRSARQAEAATHRHLRQELKVAVEGVRIDLKLNANRVAALGQQLADGRQRLGRLAGFRAEYGNLVASAQNRLELLERARRDLAEVRASRAAAHSASRIGRIGQPDGGSRPVGPGRATVTLAGAAGGLLTGFGLVWFVTFPQLPPAADAAPRRRRQTAARHRPARPDRRGRCVAPSNNRSCGVRATVESPESRVES